MTICIFRNKTKGNIINWDTADWNTSKMTEGTSTYSDVCAKARLGLTLVPGHRTHRQGKVVCQNFGGNMAVLESQNAASKVMDKINKSHVCNSMSFPLWLAWNDQRQEGNYETLINNEMVQLQGSEYYGNWLPGQPNGETVENCVKVSDDGLFLDGNCENNKLCVLCYVPSIPNFQMRGKKVLNVSLLR